MKVVVLTTRTPHHAYFVGRIAEEVEVAAVFYETHHAQAAMVKEPLFEDEEAAFEARHFRAAAMPPIPEHDVDTVNAPGVSDLIAAYKADIGLVFGCGKITPHVFGTAKEGLLNVHRGMSEKYRGLDSDLWAIHHNDIENIGVTIHKVAEVLDAGDVCRSATIPDAGALLVHQLRYFTTVLAAELMLDVLREYRDTGRLEGRPQAKGPYFSCMPLDLKRQVQQAFNAQHASELAVGWRADLFCFERRRESQLTILIYHGVTRERGQGIENFACKHLDADVFEQQMRLISQECEVLSMEDVARLCGERRSFPSNAVAVTFDDAYANVYSVAYPILQKHRIPFTFYVSTGFVDTGRMFWTDVIEDCVNRTVREELTLPTFPLPLPLRSHEERVEACRNLKRRCKHVPNATKDLIVSTLVRESGVTPRPEAAPNYRMVSWAQLDEMANDPLVTIGSHSHSHNILSQVPSDDLRQEIETSLGTLAERLGRPIRHFSYPEGGREHFNGRVIAEMKAHGIVCSPTAICGLNPRGTDPFFLRRVMVGFEGLPFPYRDASLNPIESAGVLQKLPTLTQS